MIKCVEQVELENKNILQCPLFEHSVKFLRMNAISYNFFTDGIHKILTDGCHGLQLFTIYSKLFFFAMIMNPYASLDQLCPTLGPFEGFVRPSLGFSCSESILHTDNRPYFDYLEFDIFDARGRQCHFITSVTIAVRIRTLSAH